jgi:hypothetical protein
MVANGMTNREIVDARKMNTHTVSNHIVVLRREQGVLLQTRYRLIARLREGGYGDPVDPPSESLTRTQQQAMIAVLRFPTLADAAAWMETDQASLGQHIDRAARRLGATGVHHGFVLWHAQREERLAADREESAA